MTKAILRAGVACIGSTVLMSLLSDDAVLGFIIAMLILILLNTEKPNDK